jgi:hypothetical protein
MPYAIQTNAVLPYALFAIAYLGILAFARKRRDVCACALVIAFCLALGMRDIKKMNQWADPVWYSALLTKQVSSDQILSIGGVDYLPFYLVHGITSRLLNQSGAFFVLHLLYIPGIYFLFRLSQFIKGMFFLIAGWLLFVNSGILILANFFRQGQAALYLLILILSFSLPAGNRRLRLAGALALPALHVSAFPFAGGLLISQRRRFPLLFSAVFAFFCAAVNILLQQLGTYALYLNHLDQESSRSDLIAKVIGAYVVVICALWIGRKQASFQTDLTQKVQGVMMGFLIPTAALLIFASTAPEVGTRFIYYFHAVAFMFLASAVATSKSKWIPVACAVGFCLFGAVTWTYPTIAELLIW